MKDQINNYVVVRFSLKISKDWQRKAYGDESNRDMWLKYRFDILNKTLAPSLRAQQVKPKAVFIIMDSSDREAYTNYCLDKDIVTPIFSENNNHFLQIDNYIKNESEVNVAVSRIDSDDIISKFYFESINNTIEKAIDQKDKFTYVIACMGARSDGKLLQRMYYSCAPFLTEFSTNFNKVSIYSFNHETVLERPHVTNHDYLWIQYLHGGNIANAFFDEKEEWLSYVGKVKTAGSVKKKYF